jgi:tetratricopeptide (TPR) repeat protein
MKRRTKLSLLAGLGAAVLAGGGAWIWADRSLDEARRLAKHGLWPEVRASLGRYVWVHPNDAEARLLFAEALIKDEGVPAEQATAAALEHLRAIPDSAPEGALARTQEGRVEFLFAYRPARAEALLRRAIELDPRMPEPYYLLWKVKDVTGRSYLAEPEFWKVYEASSVGVRALRLREWYMSQFYPATANMEVDRFTGRVLAEADNPHQADGMRLVRFRKAEPASPLCLAALARWCQVEGDARTGFEFLEKHGHEVENPEQDPFYMATLIGILIELGEVERADRCFEKWPPPREGYQFWVTEGKVLEEARGQYAEANRAYERALAVWPGQIDWRTRNRMANCLARLRDQPGAARQREQAKIIENLMDEKVHRSLRQALGSLNVPEQAQKLADFYQKINRPREAAAWSEHVARLKSRPIGRRDP